MWENFDLPSQNGHVEGYHWRVGSPDYVVCLIHGIGEYAACYDRMAGFFAKEGIALVGIDLPGHGKSYGKRGHAAPRKVVLDHIDSLIAYVEAEYPDIPIIIYGHSMGGNIALDYKLRGNLNHKAAGYAVSAPWIYLVRRISKPLYCVVKVLSFAVPEFLIDSGIDAKLLGNPKNIDSQTEKQLRHNKISALTAVEGFDIGAAMANRTHQGNGRADKTPMLLMHGNKDQICDIAGSRKLAAFENPHCTYIEWPELFHEIHNGGATSDGAEVMAKIVDWIKAIPEA